MTATEPSGRRPATEPGERRAATEPGERRPATEPGGRRDAAGPDKRPAAARRPPVYASVQARVRELAVMQGLKAGDRLPPERELAPLLGVSRTSLRQALMALRIEGLIEVQHGNGMYLLRSPSDTIPPITAELRHRHPELPALGEVRNALEALAAKLAAQRRTDEDLAEMVAGIWAMDTELALGEPGVGGDRRFHDAVLRAAHNPVLTELLESIAEGSGRIAAASLARPGQPARSLSAHRLILEATIVRDADLAHRLMNDHLELTGEISAAP